MAPYRINSDREKPWNTLPLLPVPEENYKTVKVYEHLGRAKEALGRLQGRSIAIPNQAMFINTISLQEAKISSEIENIFTTDDELYEAFSSGRHESSGAPKEVLRYREALWSGHQFLSKDNRFDRDYFVKIYQEIKQASDGIRPPFAQVVIKRGNTGPQAGKVIYTPPRGTGLLEQLLDNLTTFVNNNDKYPIDPLLKMAIGHCQFEMIHPFTDGNGRTGRVFNIHYLTQQGLLDYPILFLSRYILDHKSDYYSLLAGVSQRGDWENWIVFMMLAIEATANLTYSKINDIVATKDGMLEVVVAETDIRRPEQLVQKIFEQPYTRVKHLTEDRTYAENTARNYLNRLVELQILDRRSSQGHFYYENKELTRILAE